MTDNIEQVAASEDEIVTEPGQTEENVDVVQEPETALEDSGEAQEEAPEEDGETVQDVAADSEGDAEADDAEDDEPTAP